MRYTEILEEMPELIGAQDFSMMEPEHNRNLTQKLLSAPEKDILRDTKDFILFRTGTDNGNIALIDKQLEQVDYWIRFNTMQKKLVDKSVTQVAIWRRRGSPWVQGITRFVFFEYLLLHWPTVMSDAKQTPDGRDFWLDVMARATVKDFSVGLADFNASTVEWYRSDEGPFQTWIASKMSAWSGHQRSQGLRFLVSI